MFPIPRDGAVSARVSPFATAEERVSPGLETSAISINAAVWRVGYVVVSLILLFFFQTSALAFSIGDRVQVANTGGLGLNVRNCAGTSCTKITNEPDGSKGTVIGGPTSANGFTWWDINWDNNFSGWSIQADSSGTYLLYIQPQLSVGPSSLNFGSVQVGSCTSATVSIQHIAGTSPASGTVSAGPNPPFNIISGASFSLSGSGATNATIRFCPLSAGTFSGSSSVSASGAFFTTSSSVSLSGTGFVPVTTGAISVNATYNGQAWSGLVNYRLSAASTISGNTVPADFQNRTAGTYTLTFNSGGPSGSTLSSIMPSATQTLNGGGAITFSFNFLSSAPTVTTNPSNQTVSAGQTATFTAAATGNPTPTVQWQQSTGSGASFTNIAGAASTTYSLTTAASQNGYQYRAVFTNTAGTATTTAAKLTVNTAPACTKITTLNGLQNISLAGSYCLANDIDANGASFVPIGTSTTPFTGTFDGQGYEISGLTINDPGIYVGLFAYLGAGGQISNLGLTNVSVTAPSGYDVGGLVGRNSGTISKSYTTGSVTGTAGNTNGLNGIAVGGVAGWNFGTITQSYSAASVGSPGTGADLGGISGGNDGIISFSYSTGSVSSIPVSNTDNFSLGGLVGRNKTGSITQSYATGSITGGPNSVLGGLVATNDAGAGAVTNSYWDVQTTGQSSSVGGTGWTTAQLKAGLPSDFDPTVWGTGAAFNNGYPYLLWQNGGAVASAPVVTVNPTNQTVNAGQTATFSAAASGTPTPTVQWQQSTDGGMTFTNIAGATSTTYSFTTGASQNGYRYQAVFTNSAGAATTTAATLTVNGALPPPVAVNETSTTGQATPVTIDLSVGATGSPTSAAIVSSPTHGTITVIAGTKVTYTPSICFAGTDTFTFTLANASGKSTSPRRRLL
jgi:Bacterial Ig domain/Immunoglobulin I-set domain/The GLUG motif